MRSDAGGRRDTPQRQAIRAALREADRPLTPDEVLQLGRPHVPSLGIATVYRNLRALHDRGWVEAVELPGEPTRYEVAGKEHHHHFLRRLCTSAFKVEGCPGDVAALVPADFEVDDHDLVLYGRCPSCRGAGG